MEAIKLMNTHAESDKEEISSQVSDERDARKHQGFVAYMMLVMLILVSVGGIVLFCYKCEHPTSPGIIQTK
jgi:hypothetical protein